MKAKELIKQVKERELTDKELKRREEIADDLPDAEFKKRYGAAWKGIKMATATNMAKKEEVDLEEALSGREVAKRMEKLKDRGVYVLKPWAKEVAKMRTVTRDDLEKLLPDHIGGQYLTKVLESNELEETLQDNISLFSKDQIKLLQVIVPVVSVYGTKKSGSLALERTPNMDIARAVKVQMDWLKKDEFTGSTDHTSFTRDKQLTMLNDIIKKLPRLKSSAPK